MSKSYKFQKASFPDYFIVDCDVLIFLLLTGYKISTTAKIKKALGGKHFARPILLADRRKITGR